MQSISIWKEFAKNSAMILGSRAVFAPLHLATNALVVSYFGLAGLGAVLLLHAYTRLFSDIVRFQSWQTVLRFGVTAQELDNTDGLRRLLGFSFGLDFLSFAVAITAAIALVPWAAEWFEWPDDVTRFAPVFVLSLIFITHATPNGLLRLVDRVDALAIQYSLNAVLRFGGVCLTVLLGGGVLGVVIAWFAASVISGGYVYIVTFREILIHRLTPIFSVSWARIGDEHPGVWRFLVLQNAASGLALTLSYGTTVVIGGQIGPAAAAIWEIARQIGAAIAKPAPLLGPLMFPELSRIVARGDWTEMRRILTWQLAVSTLILGVLGGVILIFLPEAIRLIFGAEAGQEKWLFRLMALGALIHLTGFLMEPAFLSANKPGTVLLIQFAAITMFVLVAAASYARLELSGLGLAFLTYHVVNLALLVAIGRKLLLKRQRRARSTVGPRPTIPDP